MAVMKMKHLAVVGLSLSLVHQVWAGDLESILDEGSKATKTVQAAAAVKTTPLAQAMKKVIGTPNSEQNIFLRYVESGDWEKAAMQFPSAFEGTAFQKSPNGRALFGYVQFKAGLPVTGVQTLFMASNPKEMNPTLREEWQRMAPADHFVWGLAQVQWQNTWEVVFGDALELRLKTEEALASTKNIELLQKLSSTAPANSKEKAQIDWQLVIAYSLGDQTDRAAKLLATLMRSTYAPVSKDLMQVTAARLLFQNGYFDASVKYYEKVAKDSDYWTEAQEEMGWAYIRKGEPNNAMAVSQSLVSSSLNYQVSPEAFFVRSLSQLKVCDYTGVMDTLQTFPKRFKERTKALEAMSSEPATQDVDKGLALLKTKKIEVQDLGKSAQNLPRRFAHDDRLFQFTQAQKHLEDEAQVAEKLYAKSLALTGLQGSFEKLKQNTLQRSQMAKAAAYSRVKELAKEEVFETKEILRKLHIVEAEVIQQVSLADKIAKNAKCNDEKKGVTGYKDTAEALKFPAEDEVWFDEISNYRVDVKKACTVKR
jgi:hypothetical protein